MTTIAKFSVVEARFFRVGSLFVLTLLIIGNNLLAWQNPLSSRPWSDNVIVPQCYRNGSGYGRPTGLASPQTRLQISQIDVEVDIRDQMATTMLLFSIHNSSGTDQTAELLIPVPQGAIVRGFTFAGAEKVPATELLERDVAKRTFESIVAKLRDPALLEFAGYNMVRSSVFPVAAGRDQKIHMTLEQLLPSQNQRVDYVLPRSQSLTSDVPWSISARIRSVKSIAALYSPSHPIAVQRISDKESKISLPQKSSEPGAFRLSYLSADGPLTASLMTCPAADGKSGHFLLLAGLAETSTNHPRSSTKMRREITLIVDRSGSMNGEKIEQAKQAAAQVISGLESGEAFNILCFNSQVEQFSDRPVIKSKQTMNRAVDFIQSISASEGTNIHDALLAGLAPPVSEGCLPIVLFLTDGLPTVGNTSELAIREVAEKHNPYQRRIFSFGVGFDVNTPLLDKLATSTRGFATFVTPGENVEVAVSKVFRGLNGPVLSDVRLEIADQANDQPQRITDVLPGRLPDLYDGDQLVVMGSYRGNEPLKFLVTAKRGDKPVQFNFEFDPTELKGQPFVSRLWASRKIASLIDQVRDLGAASNIQNQQKLVSNLVVGVKSGDASSGNATQVDPQLAELTDSIINLSRKYGVLTEYTSFLATAGVDLSDSKKVKAVLGDNLWQRAINCRTGQGSWNQEINNGSLRSQVSLNLGNRYVDQTGNWVSTTNIAQCRENSLYNRSGRWIEASLIVKPEVVPDKKVEFGSAEFMELMWRLAALGRQDELSVEGEILITVDGKTVLIHANQADTTR